MGIQLDWELEAQDGISNVHEDAEIVAARARRGRLIKWALIACGVVAVISLVAALNRMREVNAMLRADLHTTVQAETLALRLGDKHAFMRIQGPAESWRAVQRTTFDNFHSLAPRVEITGEIAAIDLQGRQAEVTVIETINGQRVEAVWMYGLTEGKWRHIASPPEPWARQTRNVGNLQIIYYPPDAALADEVGTLVGDWWAMLCVATLCDDNAPHLRIVLTANPSLVNATANQVIIPSVVNGVPVSGLDAGQRSALAEVAVTQWTAYTFGVEPETVASPLVYSGPDSGGLISFGEPQMTWGQPTVNAWLWHVIDPSLPAPEFATMLTEAYGPAVMPRWLAGLRPTNFPTHALRVAIEQTAQEGNLPADDSLAEHLTLVLRAERWLHLEAGDNQADITFVNKEVSSGYAPPDQDLLDYAKFDTIQVLSTQITRDILWAEVQYEAEVPGYATPQWRFIPFRMSEGRWMHAGTVEELAWGAAIEEGRGSFYLLYHEVDQAYVDSTVSRLQGLYDQTTRDLGMAADRQQVTLDFSPFQGLTYYNTYLEIDSPHWTCCTSDEAWEYIATDMLQQLSWNRFEDSAFVSYESYDRVDQFIEAVIHWELRQAGMATDPYYYSSSLLYREHLPPALYDLWYPYSTTGYEGSVASFEVLLEIVVNRYGREAIPLLIENLPGAVSMDGWMLDSVGVSALSLQGEWQDAMDAAFMGQ